MRTYGRIDGVWVEVDTDDQGFDDMVWVTTLIQCLKLSPGESPFYANHGVPAQLSVIQQVFPDFYMARTQGQFASYFAALVLNRQPGSGDPVYQLNVTTQQGYTIRGTIAV